jgi:hypothetical protein
LRAASRFPTSWSDASFTNGSQQGNAPAPFVNGGSSASFLFWAEGLDEGADMYAQADAPGGATWLLTAEDDVSVATGRYAACAEASPQAPQYVCAPSWSGSNEDATLAYTFEPSASAATTAERDRSGPGRLRRARSAIGCRWRAAHDRACGAGADLTLDDARLFSVAPMRACW